MRRAAHRRPVEPARRAVPAPAAARARGARGRRAPRAGSASCTRPSPPAGTSRAPARLRARLRRASRPPRRRAALRGPDVVPGRPPGPRRRRAPTTCPPPRCSRSSAAPAARCCARAEVFDVYRGAQVGEGRASLAVRLEFRAADRTLTDEEVAAAAREDRRRAARAGRRASCVAEPSPGRRARRSRATRARSRRCSCTATRTSSSRTSPPARRPARGSTTSTRARACRWSSSRWDPEVQGDVDAALVCWPHGVAAPAVAALRERGVRVVDLSADFRLRDRGDLRGLVRRARRARAVRPGRLRAARAAPRRDRRRRPGRQPGLLPDRGAARARAARPRRADRRRGRSTPSPASRGAGREPTRDDALRLRRRERHAVQGRAPPPHARDRAGARRPGRAGHDHLHAAPGAARPGRARLLLRHARARVRRGRGRRRSTTTPTRASRGWSSRLGPPGVLDVRETNFCRISVHCDRRTGRILVFARDRQPLEGRRVAGRAEPQPDVRARRARGAAVSASSLALGRAARRTSPRSRRAGSPPGSAPRASPAGIKPSGDPDLGLLVCARSPTRSAPRASRRSGVLAAPVRADAEPLPARRAARRGRQLGQRQRRDRATAASRTPRAMQGAARDGRGRPRGPVAVASTGVIGVPMPMDGVPRGVLGARGSSTPDGDARLLARDRHHRRVREAPDARRRAAVGGTVRLSAQAKGAGMIQPQLRDDALLRADRRRAAARDRRPAARRLRQALLRPHLRRRPALDQRHGDPDGVGRRAAWSSSRRPRTSCALGEALDYALPPARAADGARRRGRRARRPRVRPRRPRADRRARRPRRGQLAAGQGRAQRRRPELGPDRRRPSAPRCPAPRRSRSTSTSRASRSARGGVAVPHDAAALAAAVRGHEVEYEVGLPGEGAETEVFFSDLSHGYVRSTRSTRRETTSGTLLEALPYIREFHGRTVVIKYGGAAMTDPAAARGLRARRRAPQVRRDEPDRRPRRRAGHHRATWSGSRCRSSSSAACACPTRTPSRSRRWSSSARSTRTSSCASAATGSRRSACAATTGCSSASRRWRGRRARTSATSGRIERVDAGVIRHVAEDYIPVIASVGADRDGRSHNVNADEAASAVARALGAYKVIFLTDVAGWLADPADPGVGDLARRRRRRSRRRCRRWPAACARSSRPAWTRSTAACTTRTSSTAALPHSLLLELFTDAGIGTKVRPAR